MSFKWDFYVRTMNGYKVAVEKRHPIQCPNCGTPMVGMNKYIISKSTKEIYVWHVCPRRKKNGERGCGHISPIGIKRIMPSEETAEAILNTGRMAEEVFEKSIFEGEVKTAKDLAFIIRKEDNESFDSWLHKHIKDWKGKKVRIGIREIA